jgi:hypothetical protein
VSRRYGRLVDGIWIQKRMNEKDARRERELRATQPHLFAPSVVPVVDVAIVPANPDAPIAPVVDVELQRVATRCDPDGGQ